MDELISKRLLLRTLQQKHVSVEYVDWLNDPSISKFLETRHVLWDLATVAEFVKAKSQTADEFLYGMFLRDSARHIGNIKIGPVNPHHPVAPLSLFVGDSLEWGKGYASEAIETVCCFGFEVLDLQKITAGMYALNVASIRAFEKAGFEREAHFRCHRLLEGQMVDSYEYCQLKSKWQRSASVDPTL